MAITRRSLIRAAVLGGAAASTLAAPATALGTPALGSTALGTLAGGVRQDQPLLQLAVAHPRTAEQRAVLARLDDTHAVVDGGVELLLWPGDTAALVAAGIPFRITVADLLARDRAAAAPAVDARTIPGGKADYQSLDAIYAEFTQLAQSHPDLVRVVELPEPSLEGRTVRGVEIYRLRAGEADVRARPVAYYDGCHHAREWPSADYCRLFAHHLVETAGTARTDAILDSVVVRIVPVVNVDGYVHSFTHKGAITDNANLGIVAGGQGAYVRKNNRVAPADQAHAVDAGAVVPGLGEVDPHYGVDPNRNYAYLWGGTTGGLVNGLPPAVDQQIPLYATTSPNPTDQTYFGTDAFSEPDTRNTRAFFLSRSVMTYLSNHTSGRLVLRPWGHTEDDAPDEAALAALGKALSDAMVDEENDLGPYDNRIGLGLYATNGTSNDWAYAATGTFGYVIEHSTSFHPPYGSLHAPGTQFPQAMEMFTRAAEAAADETAHGVLVGRVAAGRATLTLSRTTTTPYSRNGGARDVGSLTAGRTELEEQVLMTIDTAEDGSFEWHVNPSTRPIASEEETYALTVESASGTTTREVVVGRGQRLQLGEL